MKKCSIKQKPFIIIGYTEPVLTNKYYLTANNFLHEHGFEEMACFKISRKNHDYSFSKTIVVLKRVQININLCTTNYK